MYVYVYIYIHIHYIPWADADASRAQGSWVTEVSNGGERYQDKGEPIGTVPGQLSGPLIASALETFSALTSLFPQTALELNGVFNSC